VTSEIVEPEQTAELRERAEKMAGKAARSSKCVTDLITERRQAEEALQRSEERHRTILQTAMDGYWMTDMQRRLLEVNETYCRMSGYDTNELLSMRVSDLEVHKTAEYIAAHREKIMARGEDRFESRHRRKDGSIFDVEVSVQYRPGEGGRFVAFLRDITERKRESQALKERIKELNCLYGISALLELPGLPLDEILRRSVKLVPPAWRFPDITEACIELNGEVYRTDRFRETPWMLTSEIGVYGKPAGKITVCLLESRRKSDENTFLIEEKQLLGAIAERLCHFIERKQAEERLRILSSRLLTAQEEEQHRIAMELHDQTGQDLNVLKLHIASLRNRLRKDQASLKEEVGKILTFTDGVIEDVRRLAHGLSPSQLQVLGLCAALRALIRNFSEKTGVPIQFDGDALDKVLPSETEIVLYRIFQEALTNIYKHAEAKMVRIKVSPRCDALLIEIQDDGRGFDPCSYRMSEPTADRGMGLSALELRAQMIGADFKISSQPGKGTHISLLVPIKNMRSE
jgi:PAS domain S-box-containing protein